MRIILALATTICFLMILTLNIHTAQAAYTADGSGSPVIGTIEILSPTNTTYATGELILNVSVRSMVISIYNSEIVYSIDGTENVSLPLVSTFVPVEVTRTYANGTTETAVSQTASYYVISGETILPEQPMGEHNLTVFADYQCNSSISFSWPDLMDKQSVIFTVNNSSESPTETEVPLENLSIATPNTNLWLASIVIIAVVAVMFFIRKRKNDLKLVTKS